MDVPAYPRLLIITDAAVNISPTLEDKVDIVQNAIDLAHALRLREAQVAILSAVETVNPKIPSTIEAAALCKMADRGQITGGILDGPLAFDNAISLEAGRDQEDRLARRRAGRHPGRPRPRGRQHAGQAACRSWPTPTRAGIVLGARVPIILTSRADSVRTRLASLRGGRAGRPRPRAGSRRQAVTGMTDAILVLNAGSSSLKFSLFAERDAALEPLLRAARSRGSTPRPASSPRTRRRRRRPRRAGAEGATLGHDGALESPRRLGPASSSAGIALVGGRPPRRPRRAASTPRRCASTPRCWRRWRSFVPLAPLHQPHNLAPIRVAARAPRRSCRRWPASTPRSTARQPAVAQTFALPARDRPRRACAATASTGCPTSTSPRRCPSFDAAGGRGQDRRAPPGQRRQHVRAGGRPQRRHHDGLHRRRRPADGDALRRARSRRAALPDGRAQDGRARPREAALPAVGAARRLGHLQRHARPAGQRRPARQPADRPVRLPHRPRAGLAGRGAGRAGRPRVHRRHRRERRRHPRARSAATPPGSGVELDEAANDAGGPRISTAGSRVVGLGHPHQRGADDRPAHPAPARWRSP